MSTPEVIALIVVTVCLTILIVFTLNTINIHSLPKERLKPYQESLEVIHKAIPEIKMEIDMK